MEEISSTDVEISLGGEEAQTSEASLSSSAQSIYCYRDDRDYEVSRWFQSQEPSMSAPHDPNKVRALEFLNVYSLLNGKISQFPKHCEKFHKNNLKTCWRAGPIKNKRLCCSPHHRGYPDWPRVGSSAVYFQQIY